MKVIKPEALEELMSNALMAAGTPDDIAHDVAASLVDSNLKGVDSHGVTRIVMYLDQIAEGYIQPAARPEIAHETPTTAVVRGQRGFGIYALGYAMDVAVRKAKASQVAGVGLVDNTHTGRLGWFVENAARQNVIALLTGGGANRNARHQSVAPYGGAKRVLGTNPYAIGVPGGRFGTVLVDMSTSATAEGKLRLYRAKHEPVPPGWIVDKDGAPSTDAEDFYAGGAILPSAGHKGYGLAVISELLGDALLGLPFELNWFIIAINIEAFRPAAEFTRASEDILQKIKAVPPASGFNEVLIPGEPETRSAQRRREGGIPIDDAIWQKIEESLRKVNVDPAAVLR
ncbi:MAG: Ldh family oxidoreductase [Chloroflexi bacterium]|nr:Ldh family oxidoreductase [Chloroflexota bacterium]